jgi:hypothetical protein
MDSTRTPVSLHWLQHSTGRSIQDATLALPAYSLARGVCIKTQVTLLWSAQRQDAVAVACCGVQ